MNIKTLNRTEAAIAMKEWIDNYPALPNVEGGYIKIREDIQKMNEKIRNNAVELNEKNIQLVKDLKSEGVNLEYLSTIFQRRLPGFTPSFITDGKRSG